MKRIVVLIASILLVAMLLVFMFTYQVSFHEMVVVTTFGKAQEQTSHPTDGSRAGLYWKWPWPIQRLYSFDSRIRVLEDRLEQQETKDKQVVIIKAYVTWRIRDALAFYRSLRTEVSAERFLRDQLRSARAEVGNFRFDDLTNTDPAKVKLHEAERATWSRMQQEIEGQNAGVDILTVGFKRILLPQQITQAVFDRMKQTRQRLAQAARSEGQAIEASIRAKANSDAERIKSFANRKAMNIRAEGDEAAAQYYKTFAQNEAFAIFLRKLEALKKTLKTNSTFILDTKMSPFDMLESGSGQNHTRGPLELHTPQEIK